jgi:ABC-type Fe3+-siderophore transport system permease subunit
MNEISIRLLIIHLALSNKGYGGSKGIVDIRAVYYSLYFRTKLFTVLLVFMVLYGLISLFCHLTMIWSHRHQLRELLLYFTKYKVQSFEGYLFIIFEYCMAGHVML